MNDTKLNAEELAAKRYPVAIPGIMDDVERGRIKQVYAAAIREVAQPIADERDELREALEIISAGNVTEGKERWSLVEVIQEHYRIARQVLAKYSKP